MGFGDVLRGKIADRIGGGSPILDGEDVLRRKALERADAVRRAVEEMSERLGGERAFRLAFSRDPERPVPEVRFIFESATQDACTFRMEGPAGIAAIHVTHRQGFLDEPPSDRLRLSIMPDYRIGRGLGCGWQYGGAAQVEGTMEDIPAFIAAAEDMLAEYLADLATSSLGGEYLPGVCGQALQGDGEEPHKILAG